jgi:hypothetical protein
MGSPAACSGGTAAALGEVRRATRALCEELQASHSVTAPVAAQPPRPAAPSAPDGAGAARVWSGPSGSAAAAEPQPVPGGGGGGRALSGAGLVALPHLRRAPVHYEYVAALVDEVAEMKAVVSARKAAVLRAVTELLDPTWGTRVPRG